MSDLMGTIARSHRVASANRAQDLGAEAGATREWLAAEAFITLLRDAEGHHPDGTGEGRAQEGRGGIRPPRRTR